MEDKQKICDLLLATLRETSEYSDLLDLRYVVPEQPCRFESYVEAVWSNSYKVVIIDTSLDSGSAIIRDILQGIR